MKKIMFATALVASAAAFADPLNAISFEGYTAGQGPVVEGYEKLDAGGNAGYLYFFYTNSSAGADSSFVTNHADGATFTNRPAYYAESGTESNYLSLDTEGGTLWRSINDTNNGVGLGTAQAVASTGTYLDTLVQFTVTEDEEPTVGDGDKLAIWLQAGVGETNLMVKAKSWALEGGVPAGVATSFTVSNVSVEPGAWYRLTVKAVQTVIDPATGMIIPAFQIFIDGTEVAATTPQISAEMQDAFTGNTVWLEGMAALASANKLFPTLAGDPAALTDVTLQGVGFQGTGAVDEIVWTEDNPFPAEAIEFTLTYTGDANTTLGAVTYTVDGGEAQTVTFSEGAAQIPEGAEVTIAAPTFAGTYQLAAITTNTVEAAGASFPFTFTMSEAMTVAITSAQITYALTLPTVANASAAVTAGGTPVSDLTAIPAGTAVVVTWTVTDPDYEITAGAIQNITMNSAVTADTPTVVKKAANWVDDVSTITAGTKASEQYPSLAGTAVANADAAQLTTWAKGVGNVSFADAGKDDINVDAFLLNIANSSTAEQIAAEKEAFKLNITIAADGTPVVTLPDGKTYNGTVQLKGSTDLSTWTNVSAASKSYNFYKYELSLPAAE